MTDFSKIIHILSEHGIEFIIVGGAAAAAHGSARLTLDLDVVYRRNRENQRKLVEALKPFSPYLRGAPSGLPFHWDEKTVTMGLNFTLTTSLGALDLLGEIVGGGTYDELIPFCEKVEMFGRECFCLSLKKLIEVKRAAGRPKDLEAIAELEALDEEKENHGR